MKEWPRIVRCGKPSHRPEEARIRLGNLPRTGQNMNNVIPVQSADEARNAFMDWNRTFRHESDRAAALLACAYLDTQLGRLFTARLVEGARIKALLHHGGVLRSFGAKCEIAYSVGWISADVYADLDLMRQIRNKFAHADDHKLSMKKDPVRGYVRKLRGPDIFCDMLDAGHPASPSKIAETISASERERFDLGFAFLRARLGHEVRTSKPTPAKDGQLTYRQFFDELTFT